MSGHSKWNNIKRKKEKTDAQRGKIFTKIGREISVAVKQGGADPVSNSKLAECIKKAKSFNVPNENINRIIKKASSDSNDENYEEYAYEGYGPGNIAFIIRALTDNKNRTTANIRMYFNKYGGRLGTTGSVSYMFDEKGIIVIDNENKNILEESMMQDALDAGAIDIKSYDDSFEVFTERSDLFSVKEYLEAKNYHIVSSEISLVPKFYKEDLDSETKEKVVKFIDIIEDDDDVQEVYYDCILDD